MFFIFIIEHKKTITDFFSPENLDFMEYKKRGEYVKENFINLRIWIVI